MKVFYNNQLNVNMKSIKTVFIFLVAAVLVTACNKVTYKKTAGGMPYKLFRGNGSVPVRAGYFLKINFTRKIKDSIWFSTEGGLPIYVRVTEKPLPYDLSEIWTSLRKGDSLVATQMIDTFLARNPSGTLPPMLHKGDKIEMYVKVLDVFANDSASNADETKEKEAFAKKESVVIEKYLADKNIKAQKTPSGAFVEVITPGEGVTVDAGKYVSVKYKGTSFSGKIFDTNMDNSFGHTDPYSFTIGASGPEGSIKGFDEGLRLLKKGGSGRIYVPSMLAYGPNPQSPDIKPFEHLIFDIQLVDVQDKKPEPPAQPQMPKLDPSQGN
jgi:FKBP-type peptidyl-prolyl cis-trans isomerase